MTATWIAGCALASIASASGAVAIATTWVPSGGEHAPSSAAVVAMATPQRALAPSPPVPQAPPVAAAAVTAATAPPPPPSPPCSHAVEIRFGYDDARPPRGAADELAALVELARAHPLAEIIVAGHADQTGAELPNLILSRQRAAGIGRLLVAAGVPRERISERAYGSYVPRTGALAAQRRVTVDVREPDCRKELP